MLRRKPALAILFILSFSIPFIRTACGDDFNLTPLVAVRGEFNDNLFFTEGDETSDFITTITGALDITEKTERLDAVLQARLDGRLYKDNTDLDALDQFYRASVGYQIEPRWGIAAEAAYIRDSRPDRDVLETGLVLSAQKRNRQIYGLSTDYAISEITSTSLSYSYEKDDWEDPRLTDSDVHAAYLRFSRDTSDYVLATTGRTNFGYEHYSSPNLDVDNLVWTLGGSWEVSEKLSIQFDIGPRFTHSKFTVSRLEAETDAVFRTVSERRTNDDWGGTADLALTYSGEFTTATLRAYSRLAPVSGSTAVSQRTAAVFTVGHRLSEDLWANLSGGYYLNDAKQGETSTRDIDTQTVYISPWLRYQISRSFSLEASYGYTTVNNREDDTESHRNRVMLLLRFQQPVFD